VIERVYLDNIWSFVNFEWQPGRVAIILGANGAGKTALIDALRGLQAFLLGDASSIEPFSNASRTRWDKRREQVMELHVRGNGGAYQYALTVEHDDRDPVKNRVLSERLSFDERLLVEVAGGEVRLFADTGAESARFRAKPTRSGVGAIEPGDDNQSLAWFKDWVLHLWILRPDPRAMGPRAEPTRADWLAPDLSNFAGWYVRSLAAQQRSMFKATDALTKVLPDLLELHERGGYLHARFGNDTASESFRFDELSDGQRALIALYVLRHAVAKPGRTIVIDEPDNYVALREIQPWLAEMTEISLQDGGPQLWIISHHPEVLNLLAADYGWRFFRDGPGPTRVARFRPASGLDPAETVARGWDDE
jgi:predicted ATPase